jgi:hypothetical protein
MAIIKSDSTDLTINADGASSSLKLQINGVEKASISSAGFLTSTTIDATKLTGTIPSASYTDTDTTYAVGDGGLTQVSFTTADNTKLDGIATSANNYTHPTTAGDKHIPTGGAADQVLTYDSSGTAVWADAGGGGGKVLQVVSDFSSTRTSVSTSTWTNVGLSVSITPSATTSKILIISSPFTLISGSGANLGIRITRGSTGLIAFENITERWNHDQGQSISLTYMDSPSTTSSTTYTVQGNRGSGGGTCYFIQDRATTGGSSLIALEIGA